MKPWDKILTVSIAAYNVENFIEKALDSLISDEETLGKLEVLVIDDGSTDQTAGKALKYADKYPDSIKVISKENAGYGSTINTSLKLASGKYFKELDGDDYFEKENLSEFIKYLEKAEAQIIVSPYKNILVDKGFKEELIDNHRALGENKELIDEALYHPVIFMHELSYRTDFLRENEIKIPERCFYTDTQYVLYPFMKAKTISRFEKPVYNYRLGDLEQSVSLNGVKKHFKDAIFVAKDALEVTYGYYKSLGNSFGKREAYFTNRIKRIVSFAYTGIALMDDVKASKIMMKALDGFIKKNYPEFYELNREVKRIRLFESFNFSFYALKRKLLIR